MATPPRPTRTLRIDLETYSSVDLKKCGVARYVDAPDFEIMLFGYAFDDDAPEVIDLTCGALPEEVHNALVDPTVRKTAFNAAFEIACLDKYMVTDASQWECTSVHALYLGMPNDLHGVTQVLNFGEDLQKSRFGMTAIRYFCIPCKPTVANGGRTRNLPKHDPDRWEQFKKYCKQDVLVEREVSRRIAQFPVPAKERELWLLDQRMAKLGVLMDTDMIQAAIDCDNQLREKLTAEAVALTGLDNPNSRNQLLKWLQEEEQDDEIVDLTKKALPKILEKTESDVTRRVIELRQQLAKTSVSKYHAMARAVCHDDVLHGLTQFYGANRTGRWAGRIVQVQNLPKNTIADLHEARALLKSRDFDTLELLYGNVADVLSQLIRTAFIARPGYKFEVVDYSAIEARIVAWLAGSKWRLDVFRTHGKIYEASAEKMFHLEEGSVGRKSPYRQKGKVAELALGYGGGAGALTTMGALDMGLTEEELEPIKHAWRDANPEIVDLWYELERACKAVVSGAGERWVFVAEDQSEIKFTLKKGVLFVTLPSGRQLSYLRPRVEQEDLMRTLANGGTYVVATAGSVTYEGVDQKTKKWTRLSTWGGKMLENITQAIARDCLAEGMLALDKKGCRQLLTVHDEIVIEMPAKDYHLDKITDVLGRPIGWAPGLPLRAEGFTTPYYLKEIDG